MGTDPPVGRSDTLSLVVKSLYAIAAQEAGTAIPNEKNAASLAGHKFEDNATKAAYEALVRVGMAPNRPRHTLQLPTLSGLRQQFDVVVANGSRYYIVELKRRSHSEIEQLYAFVAKLLDYALAARLRVTSNMFTGVFVSTAPRLNDNFRQYAITYGVIPIAPDLPPCQVLQDRTKDARILQDAVDLTRQLDFPLPNAVLSGKERPQPAMLLREWQSIAQRCAHNDGSISS